MAADQEPDPNMSGQLSIDQEEFTRLQTQLIELRTKNYELKEEQSRKDGEYQQLVNNNQQLNKELEKANKSLQKSKKAREYQILVEENELLQKRLHTQEEDFKLQNTTLMDELAKVCEEKEELKRGVGGGGSNGDSLTHLQAENKALQKSLQILQEQLQTKGKEIEEGEGGGDNGEGKNDSINIRLITLEEEKKILQEQLTITEEKGRREMEDMKSEINRLEEKTKRKQEILLQVQNEKEKILSESKLSYDKLCQEKDREINTLHQEIKKMKEEEEKRQQDSESSVNLVQQLSSLKTEKEELLLKCQHLHEHQEVMGKEYEGNKVLLDELSKELQQSKEELGEMRRHCQNIETQLKISQEANDDFADQLLNEREEKQKLVEKISTIEKVADKRKSLLDELSIKEHQMATENKNKENQLTEKYESQLQSLQLELEKEREEKKDLTSSVDELSDLKRRIKSMENMRETYNEQLKETKEASGKEVARLELSLSALDEQYKGQIMKVEAQVEEEKLKTAELSEKINELETELDEKSQEIIITGKKSNNLIKDLKRQLQVAQKREEKLQESLSSEISLPPPNRQDSRHSREDSLSSVRGVIGGGDSSQQQFNEVDSGSKDDDVQTLLDKIASLQQEKWLLEEKLSHLESTSSSLAEDLIQKSTIIQHYFMENKADHSGTTSHPSPSAPAKMSPMRLMQWAKTSGKDETMAEVNRKMQRALEEALMKNIHLQQNVDMLSTQLQKEEESEKTSS